MLPELQADISKLADFADTYDAAADDLLAVLDNLSITNQTLVDQQEQLRRTFTVVDASSNVTAGFLETNEQNLISLAQTSRPVLGVFAKYSPEYPCLLNGLTRFNPMISEAFGADGDPALNLNITVSLPPRNPYVPGDQPAYIDTERPGLPGPHRHRRDDRRGAAERVLLPDARRPTASTPPTTRRPATPTAWAVAGRTTSRRARVTRTPGTPCPTTWPARQQNWTSCATSSRIRPVRSRDRSPTWPPPRWRRCCGGRR